MPIRRGDVKEHGTTTSHCRLCQTEAQCDSGGAACRKSVGTHILEPCVAKAALDLPVGPRLSTQVGSDQHSPRGTRVMTGRPRCGASCGSDSWNVRILLISASLPATSSASEIVSVLVDHRILAHIADGLLVSFFQLWSLGASLLPEADAWHRQIWLWTWCRWLHYR